MKFIHSCTMLLLFFLLSTFLLNREVTSISYSCEDILEDHPCKDVSSDKVIVPNLLSHSTQEVAIRELSQFQLNNECSENLKLFLCSIYAPTCKTNSTNYPIPPCRDFCQKISASCNVDEIQWPAELDCEKFPEDGGYCKCQTGPAEEISSGQGAQKFTCEPTPPNPICKNQDGVLIPNLMNDQTLEIATSKINHLAPLITMNCSPVTAAFSCSVLFPKCTDTGVPYPPCRDVCQAMRDGCERTLNIFGFIWPAEFECENFPNTHCVTENGTVTHEEIEEIDECESLSPFSECFEFSDKTLLPNILNETEQSEASAHISVYYPLIALGCSPDLKQFLCSVYLPQCKANRAVPPCKSLCESVRSDCEEMLSKFGFSWPEVLQCDELSNVDCARGLSETNPFKEEKVVITLPSGGQLLGKTVETIKNRKVFAFRGIPYAEPPLGDLRFRPPVAKRLTASKKPFDATKEEPECLQGDLLGHKYISGVEDCLILNVFTNDISQNSTQRPVMVFIHGGAFTLGSNKMLSPKRLLDYDVVLVTINYRLHAFGFLSTLDDASPGNFGLLDQVEALRWVQENVAAFGGDPNSVTIFGESAGSASVLFHMLSPLSKGLFHSAIAQSGSPLTSWGIQKDPVSTALSFGDDFGCSTTNTTKMIQCLRLIPATILTQGIQKYLKKTFVPFGPVTDGQFLPNTPHDLLKAGEITKVPLMIGIVKEEGIVFFPIHFGNLQPVLSNDYLTVLLSFATCTDPQLITQDAIDLVKNEYFQSVDPNDSKTIRTISYRLLSHSVIVAAHFKTVKFLAEHNSETFVYSFDLFSNRSVAHMFGVHDADTATHGDDLFFLFFDFDVNEEVSQTEDTLLRMWTTFAKYGHPTNFLENNIIPEWPSSKKDDIQIYHLNHKFHLEFYGPEHDKVIKFWLHDFNEALKIH